MNLYKLILTDSQAIIDTILSWWESFSNIENELWLTMFLYQKQDQEDEIIIVVKYNNFEISLTHILENYVINKLVILTHADILNNSEINNWDIIIPNTFISTTKSKSFFLEYAIWENYDLNKFWLILNGISVSGALEDWNDYLWDIKNNNSYSQLEILNKKDLLSKSVVINWIWDTLEVNTNLWNIAQLVI